MKTAVIGDVHGCLREFITLCDLVREKYGVARVIQIGDLMDRGPHPALCVKYAMETGIEVVRSNHDDKHVRWRRHERRAAAGGKKNPMRPFTEEMLKQHALLTDAEVDWLDTRPSYIEFDEWLAVHAGFEPGLPLEKQDGQKVTRVRYVDPGTGLMVSLEEGNAGAPAGSVPWYTKWTDRRSVIFGHQVLGRRSQMLFPDLFNHGSTEYNPGPGFCVSVDTGCVYGGALSAVIFGGAHLDFESVNARHAYYTRSIPEALR